ncbi:STAS domain-containing protein [Spirillospora sp. CA-253888]
MDDVLHLTARHTGPNLAITVTGALDFATAPQLLAYLDGVFAQLPRRPGAGTGNGNGRADRPVEQLVLDLGGVAFVDARGLGVLIAVRDRARGHRIPLLLATVSAQVHRLLTLTDLRDHFTIGSGSEDDRGSTQAPLRV